MVGMARMGVHLVEVAGEVRMHASPSRWVI